MAEAGSADDRDVLSFYEQIDEAERLAQGQGPLEFARMQEILERSLPAPPTVVLDVGGGPGAYSCWLALKGYDVHLVDPVAKHVEQATRASSSQPDHPIATVSQGDARFLAQGDESCDAVLLMGPLYHLTVREDRLKALREALRVLKPGGLVVAKAINRFASLFNGLTFGLIDEPEFLQMLQQDVADGQHRNPEGKGFFTTAYFHTPGELETEVREAGFAAGELVAVQGPGLLAKDLDERLQDAAKRKQLLDLIRAVEQERTLLGISRHFVVTGHKPGI